ncbi:MAG: tetratricopeptide repeat protein [Oscillospiraceae bacterium]
MRRNNDPMNKFGGTAFYITVPFLIALGVWSRYDTGSSLVIAAACMYAVFVPIVCAVLDEMGVGARTETLMSKEDKQIRGRCFKGIDFASIKFRKAMELYGDDHFSDAMHMFKAVEEYKLRPREQAVLSFYMGLCYRDMGYPTNAAVCFETSDKLYFTHSCVLLCAERSYVAAGNFFKAEEISDRMFEMKYDEKYYRFLWSDRGRIFLRADEPDKAIEAFETGMSKGLDLCGAYCGLAVAHLMKREIPESRSYVEKAALSGGIGGQDGFFVYYGEVARSLGLFEEVGDIVMQDENEDEENIG